jgi:hypothetical protein
MAYDGPISYLEVPFAAVAWTKEYQSPFASDENMFWEANGTSSTPVLKSKNGRRLLPHEVEPKTPYHVTYDLEPPLDQERLRCIVFGKSTASGSQPLEADRCNYVLIIWPVISDVQELSSEEPGNVYQRAGVGSLPDSWIDWTTTEVVELH